MLENRSFDHLFGFYPNVDGLKGNEYNLLNPWRPESAANPRVFVGQNAVWNIVGNEGPNHSLKSVNKQLFGVGEHLSAAQKPALTAYESPAQAIAS